MQNNIPLKDTQHGYYGDFGGAFIPELLLPNIQELLQQYEQILASEKFQSEYQFLLQQYVGRPSPLYLAKNLSEKYGYSIYLKREDLNHTGAHKINNAIGQALLAKAMGKKRIIAETGAGQHGLATATACALLKMPCTIFMGEKDVARQAPNVAKIKMLGAQVIAVTSGSKTLKDATNEALRAWIQDPENTFYLIGSVIGPHPYPELVTRLQSVISYEIKQQIQSTYGVLQPDAVMACVGGGSNAMGAFYHFIENTSVDLIAVEAAGEGLNSGLHSAALLQGKAGVLHGCKMQLLQTEDGQIQEAHSISAGLDYPGVGPFLSHLYEKKRIQVLASTNQECLNAAFELVEMEGILPALESAHALAQLSSLKNYAHVVVNLSGRGDKDLETYLTHFKKK